MTNKNKYSEKLFSSSLSSQALFSSPFLLHLLLFILPVLHICPLHLFPHSFRIFLLLLLLHLLYQHTFIYHFSCCSSPSYHIRSFCSAFRPVSSYFHHSISFSFRSSDSDQHRSGIKTLVSATTWHSSNKWTQGDRPPGSQSFKMSLPVYFAVLHKISYFVRLFHAQEVASCCPSHETHCSWYRDINP